MMIVTTRISKKLLRTVCLLFAAGGLLAGLFLFLHHADTTSKPMLPPVQTNEERVAYLQSLGWEVQPEPLETLLLQLPDPLEEPYLTYSQMQTTQGFSFSECGGKQVTRYTYAVKNHPNQGTMANLFLCEGMLVGGDLLSPGENGAQSPLIPTPEG